MPAVNPNTTFRLNWFGHGAGGLRLDTLPHDQAVKLAAADANGDGVLTMVEARDFLIKQGSVRTDGQATDVTAALNYAFGQIRGKTVNMLSTATTAMPARVLYLQLNNATNATLVEEKDLVTVVAKDPDRPKLDRRNWTAAFNTNGDVAKATQAFKASMRTYFNDLIAKGERMNAFIISGHSSGTWMLQETADHMYYANLNIRQALLELRAENAAYARLMDRVEKGAALACFHGGQLAQWRQIFPNAVFAGTRAFAPAASSHASAAIYDAAARAHGRLEDGWTLAAQPTRVDAARAEIGKGPYATHLATRELDAILPEHEAAGQELARAQQILAQAQSAYTFWSPTIADIFRVANTTPSEILTRFTQQRLDDAYAKANAYANAREGVWLLSGQSASEKPQVDQLKLEAADLFDIRKHQPRSNPQRRNVA